MSRDGCQHPDCIFRNHTDPQRSGRCLYLSITGKSRIRGLPESLQDPKRCPRYIPDGKKRRKPKKADATISEGPAWGAAARELYDKGLTDREIAEQLGLNTKQIYHWRHRREHLPLHPSHHGPTCRFDWEMAMQMHRKGCGDAEIAEAVGCSRASIYRWREKHDLLPNR